MDKTDIVRKSIKFWFDFFFFFWQNFYVQFEWQLKRVKLYVLSIRNWKQLLESLKVFPEMKKKKTNTKTKNKKQKPYFWEGII